MPNKYFKTHERFDRNPKKYDIGVFTGLKKGYEDTFSSRNYLNYPSRNTMLITNLIDPIS